MPRPITHCPRCGEPVTPYAAGCAICGADIEGARRAASERRVAVGRVGLPRLHVDEDALRVVIALLVALAAPVFGVLIACWFAWHAHGQGRTGMRNLMLAIAVLAALPLITGVSLWGRFVAG